MMSGHAEAACPSQCMNAPWPEPNLALEGVPILKMPLSWRGSDEVVTGIWFPRKPDLLGSHTQLHIGFGQGSGHLWGQDVGKRLT